MNFRELKLQRRLLGVLSGVYFLWWFLVEAVLPGHYNPLLSRVAVCLVPLLFLILSFVNNRIKIHLQNLLTFSLWLVTAHYFYLFYFNQGEINWIVGSYITVTAISYCFFTSRSVLAYSIFVLILSGVCASAIPSIQHSVFFPGLFTILLQTNIGWRSRLNLIKHLKESTEKFQQLFDSTFEGVLVHEDGVIDSSNIALSRMTGYSKSELAGKKLLDLVPEAEKPVVENLLKISSEKPFELQILRKDGNLVSVEGRGGQFNFNNKVARLVTLQDLTDRKIAEKEKVTSLAMVENVRLRDDFISIASHEFKTPIAVLKLQAELIEREFSQHKDKVYSTEDIIGLTGILNRQVNRLGELVDDMLDVSRIAAQRLTLYKEKVSLNPLIEEVISVMQIRNMVSLSAEKEISITADKSRIRQVIENLLDNAIKYGEGKPVKVSLSEENNFVTIEVEDKGQGISPEFIGRIFNRFERAVSAEHISGFGLGLFLSKEIVQAHAGTITVTSNLGNGAKFTVRLPTGFSG